MYTSHGDHIPGTRLGTNPPLKPVRCGGVGSCSDCMQEAYTVTRLEYYREDFYDEYTSTRVVRLMREAGASQDLAVHALRLMETAGILFRERKQPSS